jgi:phospholipase/carboxylesterase
MQSSTLRSVGVLVGLFAVIGCSEYTISAPETIAQPRLTSRPVALVTPSIGAGFHRFTRRSTKIVAYVPASALKRKTMPVDLLLHGSARDVEQLMKEFVPYADSAGVVILAPYAASGTWDAIKTTFGPDVAGIDVALSWLFDVLPVNPSRIGITGFSDGATYSLAIGRANGDLFTRIVAFSPGFVIDVEPVGNPPIAISHGTNDAELPYAKTRDQIVPQLKNDGYGVDFRTFEGPHWVLLELLEESLAELGDFED